MHTASRDYVSGNELQMDYESWARHNEQLAQRWRDQAETSIQNSLTAYWAAVQRGESIGEQQQIDMTPAPANTTGSDLATGIIPRNVSHTQTVEEMARRGMEQRSELKDKWESELLRYYEIVMDRYRETENIDALVQDDYWTSLPGITREVEKEHRTYKARLESFLSNSRLQRMRYIVARCDGCDRILLKRRKKGKQQRSRMTYGVRWAATAEPAHRCDCIHGPDNP